jgi:hypothetical protein
MGLLHTILDLRLAAGDLAGAHAAAEEIAILAHQRDIVPAGQLALARLRGFADFEGVCSLFIKELDENVFTTSGVVGDGYGGDFGGRLRRQLQLELLDQELEFRFGLSIAGQQQLASIGGR